MKNILFKSLGLFMLFYCTSAYGETKQFKITIQRTFQINDNCFTGYLSINDQPAVCNTLELPWAYNFNDISCIPEGKYAGTIRTDGKKGWRIQLEGVPGRQYVQIHIGNYLREIEGCILVGEDAAPDKCEVYSSKSALQNLRTAFETEIFLGNINMSPSIIVEII